MNRFVVRHRPANRRFAFAASLVIASLSRAIAVADSPPPIEPAKRPNIVVIVADDLGYADLGCQGCKDVPTPHVDSLARNGVRFTDGYVSCPVCSPTRAGLMTGRYQQRFGHEFNPGPPTDANEGFGLPLTEITLADRLKAAGYATGMVGKWHLGQKKPFHPLSRGFESYYGFLHGAHSYLDPRADGNNPLLRGFEPVEKEEYLTDAFAREAVAFIDQHRKGPFFLYMPFNAVHAPLQATEKYAARFDKIADPKRRTFAAMLSAMDDAVGAILKKLADAGLERDTLIFFVSDNGGPTPSTTSRNDPLRAFKGTVWEGGIRVPYLIQWKGHLPPGKTYAKPVIALDVYPTALAAAGGKPPTDRPIDGVNLLPYLAGEKEGAPHETLYWRFGQQAAIRHGDWKLVMIDDNPPQLFNLADDVGESKDLSAQKAPLVAELQAKWNAWNKQLAEPRWHRAERSVQRANRAAVGAATRPAGARRANRQP